MIAAAAELFYEKFSAKCAPSEMANNDEETTNYFSEAYMKIPILSSLNFPWVDQVIKNQTRPIYKKHKNNEVSFKPFLCNRTLQLCQTAMVSCMD